MSGAGSDKKVGEFGFMGWTFEVFETGERNKYQIRPTQECPPPVLALMKEDLERMTARMLAQVTGKPGY